MRSARVTVARRCAMTSVVRPCMIESSARCTSVSLSEVERARRFVKEQDRRIAQHGTRNGDALTLASRQRHAALA